MSTASVTAASVSAAEILRDARALIEHGWCQDSAAVDARGVAVDPTARSACAWCVSGALNRALHTPNHDRRDYFTFFRARAALAQIVGADPAVIGQIVVWNDHPERTQAEVLAAFDRAIAAAEVQQ